MEYIWLIVGFGLLIKGADYFVDGSSNIARLLRVPPLLIGLTIVAFGTSSPEAAVSIVAALNGNADVALGNAVGSNVFMVTLVIGLTAMIFPLRVESDTIRKEIPFTFLASVVLLVMMADRFLQGMNENLITRSDGVIMLCIFSIFIYYIVEAARSSRNQTETPAQQKAKQIKVWKNIVYTVGGLAAIILGGHLVVNSSTEIALAWGMSETLVGLTIVAIGTSLPELITSIAAAFKKEIDIAIGSVVGSCIFNILLVLGLTSLITPLGVNAGLFVVVIIMALVTVLLFQLSITKRMINRMEGMLMVIAYGGYLAYIIMQT